MQAIFKLMLTDAQNYTVMLCNLTRCWNGEKGVLLRLERMSYAGADQGYALPYEQEVLSILRKFGIARARLFGSAARGEPTETSDVDLLVESEGPVDYSQLLLLQEVLEDATGRSVDIITSIKPVF